MKKFKRNGFLKGNSLKKFLPFFLVLASGFCVYFTASYLGGQEIDLLISPGKLSKSHSYLTGVNNCSKCHSEKKKADPLKCLACHRDLAERIKAGRGWHRKKSSECITCHPEHQGEDFNLIEWDLKKFSHGETGYHLTGLHKKITVCAVCHNPANSLPGKKGKTYLIKDTGCAACHPDPHRGQLGTQCARCHAAEVPFKQVVIDHGKTGFPLIGAHKNLACVLCHINKKWKGLSFSLCSDCHADPHQPSLGKDCLTCHDKGSFKTAKFNHEQTRFPLRGKHSALNCVKCHPRGEKNKKIAFANCSDCHRRDPHSGQFGQDCQTCHVVDGFEKVSFNHDNTIFPLTGKHAAVACQKCHTKKNAAGSTVYKSLSKACNDCHADVHLKQFSGNCDACHSTQGFSGAALNFNHQTDAVFPLLGKHAMISCQKCHVKTRMIFPAGQGETVLYKPIAVQCFNCHDDYHQGQLGNDCRQCHGFAAFKPAAGFDHQRTNFSLQGFHENVSCRKCHPLIRTTSIAGKTMETVLYKPLETNCRECHREFDHAKTGFLLTGKHSGLDCRACHNQMDPNTGKTPKGPWICTECHESPHPGLPRNCPDCHTASGWRVEPW